MEWNGIFIIFINFHNFSIFFFSISPSSPFHDSRGKRGEEVVKCQKVGRHMPTTPLPHHCPSSPLHCLLPLPPFMAGLFCLFTPLKQKDRIEKVKMPFPSLFLSLFMLLSFPPIFAIYDEILHYRGIRDR